MHVGRVKNVIYTTDRVGLHMTGWVGPGPEKGLTRGQLWSINPCSSYAGAVGLCHVDMSVKFMNP